MERHRKWEQEEEVAAPWLKNYEEGVPPHLPYPKISLPALWQETAASFPQNVALIFGDKKITYQDLKRNVDALTGALLALGVKKGEPVGLLMPNCPPYIIAYHAILQSGGIVANLNPLAVERELLFFLKDAQLKTVLLVDYLFPRISSIRKDGYLENIIVANLKDWGGMPESYSEKKMHILDLPRQGIFALESLVTKYMNRSWPKVEICPEDEAVFQYSGAIAEGSRAVVLTHGNLIANTCQLISWAVRARLGKEIFLSVLPFFHVYGMAVAMNMPLSLAATLVILPRFEVRQALLTIRRYQPTFFPGVPPMFVALAQEKDAEKFNLSSLRVCYSGGAPLAIEVLEEFEKLTGARITEGYGLAEASPATHCNPIYGKRKVGSVGLPYPDTLAKIVDLETGERVLPPGEVGELCLKGPQVMKGYWKHPEETAMAIRDGWLYTGDIARMDEEGYFYILDLKKDMIIAGGFNIYPKDIDQVLREHPKIAEAVAVGIPDRYRGQTVKAYVVLKPGQTASEEEILNFCRQNLAKYKVPTQVEFRPQLPKTTSGKILRRILRQEALEKNKK